MVEGDGEEEGAGREAGVEESKTAKADATATALQTLDEVKHILATSLSFFTYHAAPVQLRRRPW